MDVEASWEARASDMASGWGRGGGEEERAEGVWVGDELLVSALLVVSDGAV